MNGAHQLLQAASDAGIEVCFANPGTTELPLVAALDDVPIRPVLCLAESVCAGAADGYGRMAGKPALTLLHLGPGMANALSNLHNARRARTPIVNVVGEHPLWHRNNDPPLESDIEALARTTSTWVRTTHRPCDSGRDMIDAVQAAIGKLGVATLVMPADCQWGDAGDTRVSPAALTRAFASDAVISGAEALRAGGSSAALVVGGAGLGETGLLLAAQIAAATKCRLMCTRLPARMERGRHLPVPARLGYYEDQLVRQFEGVRAVVLAGATAPVSFFAEQGGTGQLLPPGLRLETLARPEDDVVGALGALAEALGAGSKHEPPAATKPELPTGSLSSENLGLAIAALQPEGAIIVDESITLVRARQPYFAAASGCPPHTLLTLTGGSLGIGIPCATGAAIACPDRPVISIQADGSALYTIQGLWTQARESLNVTTLICSNRRYEILRYEMERAGQSPTGHAAEQLTDIANPAIDFVAIARGLGVPAHRCETVESLVDQFRGALAEPGPHLIEIPL